MTVTLSSDSVPSAVFYIGQDPARVRTISNKKFLSNMGVVHAISEKIAEDLKATHLARPNRIDWWVWSSVSPNRRYA